MTVGTNWARHYEYRASTLHTPSNLAQLQEVVAAAPRIRALGSRHSFHDLADSAELVSLESLPAAIRIDVESETVSFSAGVRYGELAPVLAASGWALRNLASLPHITVAGAIATGTHGSGDGNGTLSRAVAGLEIITASGALRTITPADPDFDGAVVSLGALGIVHRITLDIEPTFEVRQDVYEGLTWSTLLSEFDAIMGRAYSVSVFTQWAGEDVGRVWLKSVLGERRPPQSLYGATPALGARHPIHDMPTDYTTQQGGVPGPWLDRLPHFRLDHTPSNGNELQSEYIVPRRHAVAAVSAIRALSDRITPHLHISELRSIAADSLWLSGAYDTDALAIHFTWKYEPDAVLPLLPVVEEALAPFEARPHWGKLFHEVDRTRYPRLPDFVALMERMDPGAKFRNDFIERNVL
ncbi:xylitol oxidase [Microbacteriaceae bacterium SG_E_30_P1]|uniref:Xylitol oxidase n=1 Tax=Antiquaquibacter oligotrophicus TaxID=2880260 RepID=A0ABT6KPR8_9MICO|nr:FAD-binding protein [Antiquaquibacter oligotrophicus]MDH6181179.1 xylitol oxidase [Antiquaquibacter oligotrophicus]UDF13126.1 FAD-binding protein [Antiquaquibacter oligotrophicus]